MPACGWHTRDQKSHTPGQDLEQRIPRVPALTAAIAAQCLVEAEKKAPAPSVMCLPRGHHVPGADEDPLRGTSPAAAGVRDTISMDTKDCNISGVQGNGFLRPPCPKQGAKALSSVVLSCWHPEGVQPMPLHHHVELLVGEGHPHSSRGVVRTWSMSDTSQQASKPASQQDSKPAS